MFKVAAALVLVLLAALQVVLASDPPIVVGIGKHSDAAKEVVRHGWAEMDDVSELLSALHVSPLTAVEDGKSMRFVLTMPYFPTIIYLGGVSMSLIDISIEVVMERPIFLDHFPKTDDIIIPIRTPSMSFTAGSYVAGGKINNLPFVGTGSSSARIAMTNLNITLSYEPMGLVNICPKANTTHFEMTLDQLSINFEDLNPGQDSGDLINAMLSSVTDDFTKMVNLLMDKPAALDLLERLIRVILNQLPVVNCKDGDSSDDKQADDLDGGLGSHGNSLAEFTKVLENMLSGRLEIPEEGKELLELVVDLLPEMDLFNADFTQ